MLWFEFFFCLSEYGMLQVKSGDMFFLSCLSNVLFLMLAFHRCLNLTHGMDLLINIST